MKHGRPDYARITDPAANIELLEAFRRARDRVLDAGRDPAGDTESLANLVAVLTPLLHPILAQPPRNPVALDEPVFLLRGNDMLAARTVREYARYYRQTAHGNDTWYWHEKITDVAKAMEEWGAKHTLKLPDAPPPGGSPK